MTSSADTQADDVQAPVDERDFSQRPEDESDQIRMLKILVVIALIGVGLLAIPIFFVLFSGGLQGFVEEDVPNQNIIEEEPIEEARPDEEDIPVDEAPPEEPADQPGLTEYSHRRPRGDS